jgi:glycosyltransferase involved in cell wall biosynthesis
VLEGYFSRPVAAFYRVLETAMARRSDRLIGVSSATVDDLVRLGVAERSKFTVVPLGLELDGFLALPPEAEPDAAFRRELGIEPDEVLATFVGRLVSIKRVDVLLRAVARARALGAPVRLAIVGDGELRGQLEAQAAALGCAEHVHFLGYRRDLTAIVAGTDIAVLTSHNEGTPVALIEAAAGARPLVATRAGGVPDVVADGAGLVAEREDDEGIARALVRLAGDRSLRLRMGEGARAHVRSRYGHEALIDRMTALYEDLLSERRDRTPTA